MSAYLKGKMIAKVLHQDKGLLLGWSGGLSGIATGVTVAHLYSPLEQAIIVNFIVLLFFGAALFLLSKRVDDIYLAIYALALFILSALSPSFHMFVPATTLLRAGSFMQFFRQVE
jgi:hypothetical protein